MVNQMLTTGIFLDRLKLAKVKPIFKKDDKNSFTNYRPISLLPSISKNFEKVIYDQLYAYFQSNNLSPPPTNMDLDLITQLNGHVLK